MKYEDETVLVVSQRGLALWLYVEFISRHATGQLASDAGCDFALGLAQCRSTGHMA